MKTNIINFPDLKKALLREKAETSFVYYTPSHIDELKKEFSNKKYFIKTYGCQANVRDSEVLKGYLENINMDEIYDVEKADLIILNTCAVRENAEDKVYGEIGHLKLLKKKKKNLIIALCGCMVEQPAILDFVNEKFPYVSLFFGTHEVPLFLDYLYLLIKNNERIISVKSQAGEVFECLPSKRNSPFKAFVNIIYGCNKFCTYCIVPYTRGKERSRKFEDILSEVKELKKEGYKEITLLGQNVNAYGKDLNEGHDFSDLLEEVAKIGIPRVRFITSHPWDFSSKMIDTIAKYPNIMKCIHLPFQSGSSSMLKKMGRRYDREHYLSLVKEMREKIKGLSLSTDIIVGFPNESEEEFNETLSLVDIVKFESAFTFIYSPRKGTPASRMIDNVTKEEKSRRFKELVKHLEYNISRDSLNYIGGTYKVLVESVSKTNEDMLSGYTESNKLVHFKADKNIIGQIVNVKILESHTYSLIGEIVND